MKKVLTILFVFGSFGYVLGQGLSQPPSGDNQKAGVWQYIGPVKVVIQYSSPDVHDSSGKDRTDHIWGELVHYGFINQGFGVPEAPWRAGANENTVISFSHDVKIEGKALKAGKYGLFLATSKEGAWTWIFSNNSSSWGSYFYDKNEDALRVEVMPEEAPYTEWLTYGFTDRQSRSTTAYLQWEKLKIPFSIEADVNKVYVEKMRNQLRGNIGFDTKNFAAAANFCAINKINLEEALTWIKSASNPIFGGKEDFDNLKIKSKILEAMGKREEAGQAMDKALEIVATPATVLHQYGRELLSSGDNVKAMEVFQLNAKRHPEDKFTPNVGLARAYSAIGKTKSAIKYWERAIENIPENQKPNLEYYLTELKELKTE